MATITLPEAEVETSRQETKKSATKYVYFFGGGKADGNGKMKDVLGGKGAGLAEMTNAGLPVPPLLATSGADAMMLIEDVGDVRLQDWLCEHSEPAAIQAYRHAIELIVRIQDATEAALEADCICSHLAFDEGVYGVSIGGDRAAFQISGVVLQDCWIPYSFGASLHSLLVGPLDIFHSKSYVRDSVSVGQDEPGYRMVWDKGGC